MRHHKSMISIAVGSVLVTSLSTASIVRAADDAPTANNPFAIQSLPQGYMVAYADRVDPSKYGTATKEYGAATKGGEGKWR